LGVVWLALRAEARRRWRSWLAIVLLISVVGGIALGAAAGGRRTQAAFPSFLAAHGYDVDVYLSTPVPEIARLPGVTNVTTLAGPDNGTPVCEGCSHPINPTDFGVTYVSPGKRSPYKLVSGHLPDRSSPTQVLASYSLQEDGVHLGTVIRVPFYALSQAAAYNDAEGTLPKPTGPTVSFRVVGFEASEFEFPAGGTPTYLLYVSKALARSLFPKTPTGAVYFVNLRDGAAGIPRLDAELHALSAKGVEGYEGQIGIAQSIEASIHPQAIGWWILAGLAALVGLAVVGQGLARQSGVESEDYPTMAALGVTRRQLTALGLLRNLVVGAAGAAGALVLAFLVSPIAPLGEARVAETSAGLLFDTPVLVIGAVAVAVVVFALGLWPAARVASTWQTDERAASSRPSALVGHLAASGAPPSAVVGVRNALERRSGGASIPVGSALLGMVLAVTALVGTAVFGSSLSHLTATPALYGDRFALNFTDPGVGAPDPALVRSLQHDPAVTAVTHGFAAEIAVNRVAVGVVVGTALRGPLLFSSVDGHLPRGTDQIGLGAATMRQVGAHLGSTVRVSATSPSGAKRTSQFEVVGEESFPVLAGSVGLGTGSMLTFSGYDDLACPAGPRRAACEQAVQESGEGSGLLVSVVSGPRGQAAINHFLDAFPSIAALAITPTSLINFGEAVNFPLIFGAMLAVFGAATLAHLLIVSVSRRRRDVGLLKVVGFVNRQVATAVGWQATTLALAGIVVGVPLGVAVGRAVWDAFATNIGAVPDSVVPVGLLCLLVAGVVVVANLIAVVPALVATRAKAGDLLRVS
jgi:ABC-type lipoprotein release transport system permease subunit